MIFSVQTLATVLLFFQTSEFYVKTEYKEITSIGWLVIIGLPLVMLFGLGWLIVKFLKKPKVN